MKLDTPCIGICSTVYGDDICRGCKRTYKEVIDWNTYGHAEKRHVFSRLDRDIATVISQYIQSIDDGSLRQAIKTLSIRCDQESSLFVLAYYWLRSEHSSQSVINAPFTLKQAFTSKTLTELFTDIDNQLYALSNQVFTESSSV